MAGLAMVGFGLGRTDLDLGAVAITGGGEGVRCPGHQI